MESYYNTSNMAVSAKYTTVFIRMTSLGKRSRNKRSRVLPQLLKETRRMAFARVFFRIENVGKRATG